MHNTDGSVGEIQELNNRKTETIHRISTWKICLHTLTFTSIIFGNYCLWFLPIHLFTNIHILTLLILSLMITSVLLTIYFQRQQITTIDLEIKELEDTSKKSQHQLKNSLTNPCQYGSVEKFEEIKNEKENDAKPKSEPYKSNKSKELSGLYFLARPRFSNVPVQRVRGKKRKRSFTNNRPRSSGPSATKSNR